MHVRGRGSAAAQPQCKPCAPGFFKSATSTINSCTAHTKCPPGKHTIASGSTTSQPKCETCATGFYKAITSESSTCVGTPGRSGPFYAQTSLHCVVGTRNRLHNSYCFFIDWILAWRFDSCEHLFENDRRLSIPQRRQGLCTTQFRNRAYHYKSFRLSCVVYLRPHNKVI